MARHRRSVGSNVANNTNENDKNDGNTQTTNCSAATVNNNDNNSTKSSSNASHSSSTSSISADLSTKAKIMHKKKTIIAEQSSAGAVLSTWKTVLGFLCLGVASYFGYVGYLETRVNTPFDNIRMVQRTGLDDPERYWGTYRALNYFGLKTRDPHSLVTGLMWYFPNDLAHGEKGVRHWCDLNDKLKKYTWTHHDGRTFGVQEIRDGAFLLKTSFIKSNSHKQFGGDWTARISVRNVTRTHHRTISLIWYVALDERTNGHINYVSDDARPKSGIYGETQGLGEFQIRLHPIKGKILHKSYLSTVAPSLSKLTDTVYSHFRVFPDTATDRYIGLPGEIVSASKGANIKPNFIAIQVTVDLDFSMDITYQSTSGFALGETMPKLPVAAHYTAFLQEKIAEFERRFEDTFQLKAQGFSTEQIRFAQDAMSNMVGSIGYFYGSSRVQSVHTKNPVPYWKAPLYTAVPSRSFFPRGFLWDEGFHGLLISSWDLDIELDIICHWFDLLNVEGWIPREQILGVEAIEKVPEEFVTQNNTNANPPTFLLTLRKILNQHKLDLSVKGRFNTLERLYPRLQAWFAWFNNTQRGEIAGSYMWQGRNSHTMLELNPKTLTSGLDDYPRSSHPTANERHVDLRCWIAFAADVMSEFSSLLGKDERKYAETAAYLKDNNMLNALHLSSKTNTYADWGLHSDKVDLKRVTLEKRKKDIYQAANPGIPYMVRVTLEEPEYKYVDSSFGYVSLFPFLMEILEHNSPYLEKILDNIYDPEILWTKYGIRSLSKKSPLYMKRNTEHDPPYWRGPIWININYLVLKSLKYYSQGDGPYATRASNIYKELRSNLINNLYAEYQRTGFLWEQYDDSTGKGKGCYPFTGWTSLIVLIMAEQF